MCRRRCRAGCHPAATFTEGEQAPRRFHCSGEDPHGPVLLLTETSDVIDDNRATLATLDEAPAVLMALPIGHLDVLIELAMRSHISPNTFCANLNKLDINLDKIDVMLHKSNMAAQLPTLCPSCAHVLAVERLRCAECRTQVDGEFELPDLLRLPADDVAFIVSFVKASGSLKEMARLRGQSYPTIRNRLDEIIERLAEIDMRPAPREHEVLDAVAKGRMSVAEAIKKLCEVKP